MQNPIRFVLLGILAFVWGSSFILMKEGLKTYSPVQVAGLRLIVAGITMLPFSVKFIKQMKSTDWAPMLIVAFFGNGIPYFLFAFAQTRLGSAVTGMLNSLVPMFTLLIGLLLFQAKVSNSKLYGVLLGLAGAIILIFSSGADTSGQYGYGALVILATICYALSVNTLKARLSNFNPLATAAIPIGIAMLPMLIYIPLVEPIAIGSLSKQGLISLSAVSILGFIGTAVAMILFNRIIQLSSAVFASSVTYLIPVVALFWGIGSGEHITYWHFAGLITVLTAVYLINKKERKIIA
ncbi:EamA family transporter [bacterium]|nr:EamA family transporter [bacterium]